MKLRINIKAAIFIAVIHFVVGIGSVFLGVSASLHAAYAGGLDPSLVPTYIFTFPLTTFFELAHKRDGFGIAGDIFALALQSLCWGMLFSLLWPKSHPSMPSGERASTRGLDAAQLGCLGAFILVVTCAVIGFCLVLRSSSP